MDDDIADAIRRGLIPEIIQQARIAEALQMEAKAFEAKSKATAIATAEEEIRNDPFRSFTPQQQPLQQLVQPIQPRQTRK